MKHVGDHVKRLLLELHKGNLLLWVRYVWVQRNNTASEMKLNVQIKICHGYKLNSLFALVQHHWVYPAVRTKKVWSFSIYEPIEVRFSSSPSGKWITLVKEGDTALKGTTQGFLTAVCLNIESMT